MTRQNHQSPSPLRRGLAILAATVVAGLVAVQPLQAADPVKLGLVAALSGTVGAVR